MNCIALKNIYLLRARLVHYLSISGYSYKHEDGIYEKLSGVQ